MPLGELLWKPDEESIRKSTLTKYMEWVKVEHDITADSYGQLWKWSISDVGSFWESLLDYFNVRHTGSYKSAVDHLTMPGTHWFSGAHVNYAENVLAHGRRGGIAITSISEDGSRTSLSWEELGKRTASLSAYLRSLGVKKGDRVAAYINNGWEAVVSLLASASIGAIFSSVSLEFGPTGALDRLGQISPKVIIAANGYSYRGKRFDRAEIVSSIISNMEGVQSVLRIGDLQVKSKDFYEALEENKGERLEFEQTGFDDPLWILFTSGTTGMPKPVVHGHGGIVLEHLKAMALQHDVKPDDVVFWYTTTSWMMWNYVLGGLLVGARVILYDGSALYPNPERLWEMAEKENISLFGVSAPFIHTCMRDCPELGGSFNFKSMRSIGSTGSPLLPDDYRWVYRKVKDDVWLASISGGTDVCTAFVGACPTLPVYAGEIQCIALGASVESYDELGKGIVGSPGELVLTKPMPSMPLYIWGDIDYEKYMNAYFSVYPGVWRHGDWIEITERGTCIVYGRSDSTIKRMGVRIGTGEIYSVVESLPEVKESLAVEAKSKLLLFISLREGLALDEAVSKKINAVISSQLSPHFVPDKIYQVEEVPKTINGKKLEVPVKRILNGVPPEIAVNPASVANPSSLEFFAKLAKTL